MSDILVPAADALIEPLLDCAARAAADERWTPVAGFEGLYEVSALGRVRSVARVVLRKNGRTQSVKARVLKPQKRKFGYLGIVLSRDGKSYPFTLHRLVLESFVGQRDPWQECCHCNGNPSDNRLSNLRWDTKESNTSDRPIHRPDRYLSPQCVKEIALTQGSNRAVAKSFGVAKSTVQRIRQRINRAETEAA